MKRRVFGFEFGVAASLSLSVSVGCLFFSHFFLCCVVGFFSELVFSRSGLFLLPLGRVRSPSAPL